jgi:dihydrofolate reductase
MARLVVFNNVTLDGVMQSPGGPDEDTRGGFRDGGWAAARGADPDLGKVEGESMGGTGGLLFGRWTYEQFHSFWPHQTDNPFTDVLDRTRKYVVSTTLDEPLPWQNSTLIKGDVARAVAELKEQSAGDLVVLGSGELIQTLMREDLVDEYVLLIHPVVLGAGSKLFRDGGPTSNLSLVDSMTTRSGVLVGTYRTGAGQPS